MVTYINQCKRSQSIINQVKHCRYMKYSNITGRTGYARQSLTYKRIATHLSSANWETNNSRNWQRQCATHLPHNTISTYHGQVTPWLYLVIVGGLVFPHKGDSNVENVSMSWHHKDMALEVIIDPDNGLLPVLEPSHYLNQCLRIVTSINRNTLHGFE